jgi:hypothetical protein
VGRRRLGLPVLRESGGGSTLVGDFDQATMVLVGVASNPMLGKGGLDEGTTDFTIENVLKSNDFIKDKKVITLPRYLNNPKKNKLVIFCDVYKGKIDPYRGIEVTPDSDLVKYLSGAVALKDKKAPERLRYCFDFLNSAELDVAIDAYREFAKADYKDYKDMAKKLPADKIAGWLKDPKTPPYRYGLYASLLGHCGNADDAKLLRQMIDDPEKRKGSGIDGLLAAYLMLDPKGGWTYVTDLLKDGKQEFLIRFAGLRTLRFLWDQRPDLVPQKELVQGMTQLLPHVDMADLAIEDLRRWKQWDQTDKVLNLFDKKSHDIKFIRRSILRFALQSPSPRAAAFVLEQRQRDAQWVKDTEDLLKLDN